MQCRPYEERKIILIVTILVFIIIFSSKIKNTVEFEQIIFFILFELVFFIPKINTKLYW